MHFPLTKNFRIFVSHSLIVAMLATQSYPNAFVFNGQPQFTIKADKNKAFNESFLIGNFTITNGNIADCLERCLEDCRCQSFQVCENTKCQLCSSHKEENSSLLYDNNRCVYATYEIKNLFEMFQVYIISNVVFKYSAFLVPKFNSLNMDIISSFI